MPNVTETWNQWYQAHAKAMVLLARQWAATPADAEDIVHDAFIRFWNRREKVENPTAFLYACVRRLAIDYTRSLQRRRTREQMVSESRDEACWFESSIEEDERRQQIEIALTKLPIEQREVIVMKIWSGLTFPAIAEATEVSANTAASRYRYGMTALKQHLIKDSEN